MTTSTRPLYARRCARPLECGGRRLGAGLADDVAMQQTEGMAVEPSRETLFLVPTEVERRLFRQTVGSRVDSPQFQLCGFGPVAAAARTAQLIAQCQPRQILLLGIAGSYDLELLPVGQATCFASVALHGIGIGPFSSLSELSDLLDAGQAASDCQQDRLSLAQPAEGQPDRAARDSASSIAQDLLVTCCAPSHSSVDSEQRRRAFPEALAEDMEGFGVALACCLCDKPLTIVRGASNQAGDRDQNRWQVEAAIEAAWELVKQTGLASTT